MRDIAHEAQHHLEIVTIDVPTVLHTLADQPQNFQTTEHNLMVPETGHGRLHETSYTVFEVLMGGKYSSRNSTRARSFYDKLAWFLTQGLSSSKEEA